MTDYVISEEQLNRCKMGWCVKPEDKRDILARPLSDELEKAYRHGFNDGQAEGLPEALKTERKRVLTVLLSKLDACITSCPSEAKQKPTTILQYVRKTVESLRGEA